MIILHRKFPPGGTVGQFLRKCSSTDNDVEWANVPSGSSLPAGGTTGQALRKASNADQDVSWQNDPDPFPTGGSTGQVLTKTASGQAWQNVPTELPLGGTDSQILMHGSSNNKYWGTPIMFVDARASVIIQSTAYTNNSMVNVYINGTTKTLYQACSDIMANNCIPVFLFNTADSYNTIKVSPSIFGMYTYYIRFDYYDEYFGNVKAALKVTSTKISLIIV